MNVSYIHKIGSEQRRQHKIFQTLFSLSLSLFVIFASVKLTLAFKALYYFDIQYLNIPEQSGFSKAEIIKNYDYVINYLLSTRSQEFRLPSIPYSIYGQIHFKDVKRIFTAIDILLLATGLISVLGLFTSIKHKSFYFLKQVSSMLILLPAILITAFMINFDKAFILFHKIFFRNNYWQFDPDLDPIINILPEEFFYHSALLIVGILIIAILSLNLLYRRLSLKNQTY